MIRTLFFGTPEIAVPALRALADTTELVALVAQPDRPAGRGLEVKPVPTKAAALELGIEVHQPTKVKTPDFAAWVADRRADVAVVMAYGRILPTAVLAAPRLGCVNLHASILPAYRGANPISSAILKGDPETGVTLMRMDRGLDTGDILDVVRTPILPDDTTDMLTARLAHLAADQLAANLEALLDGSIIATPQPEGATITRQLVKADGWIDWSRPAAEIERQTRAMWPWPRAWTTC